MEPLGILGVAASAVQFIDFTTRLLSTTAKTYKSASGQTENVVSLTSVANDLDSLARRVSEKASKLSAQAPPNSSASEGPDETLVRLCTECSEIGTEMITILSTLKAKGTTKFELAKHSIVTAVKTIRSESRITNLRERLLTVRQQMMMCALFSVWESAQVEGQSLDQMFTKQVEMMETLGRIDQWTKDFEIQMKNLVSRSVTNGTIIQEQRTQEMPPVNPHTDSDSDDSDRDPLLQRRIIDSLDFQGIHDREDSIPTAYEKTFEWLYEWEPTPSADERSWSSFPQWLEEDTKEIYWITGKPGSGKSTLMKFLTDQENLTDHLAVWAGKRQLLTADFYFWNPGSEMQKSYHGLVQSLLHQCLCQCPHMATTVAPKRRLEQIRLGGESSSRWEWEELIESFEAFASHSGTEFVVAFFIDGLDEYNGDHSKIVDFLKRLNKRDGIKICTSSRPWNIFNDSFVRSPSLRLQDLTLNDITLYVHGHFDSQPAFAELHGLDCEGAEQLLQNIISKASGVFLWVSIVVRALLERLRDGDELGDLHETLDSLPEDLEQLFWTIRRKINPAYLSHSAQYFMIHESWCHSQGEFADAERPDALEFILADQEDDITLSRDLSNIYDPINVPTHSLYGKQSTLAGVTRKSLLIGTLRRRLNSRTMGLLEVVCSAGGDHYYVAYLHRTVHEWVSKPENWAMICEEAQPNFDAHLELLKANVALMTSGRRWKSAESPESVIRAAMTSREHLWGRVEACLRYAAKVNPDYLCNKPRLLKMIKKMDENGWRILMSNIPEADGQTFVFNTPLVSGYQGQVIIPHWSWTEYRDDKRELWGRVSRLLGLTARFMVQWHVGEAPRILNRVDQSVRQDLWLSVVRDAMLQRDPNLTTRVEFSGVAVTSSQLDRYSPQRQEMVRFLLHIPQVNLDPEYTICALAPFRNDWSCLPEFLKQCEAQCKVMELGTSTPPTRHVHMERPTAGPPVSELPVSELPGSELSVSGLPHSETSILALPARDPPTPQANHQPEDVAETTSHSTNKLATPHLHPERQHPLSAVSTNCTKWVFFILSLFSLTMFYSGLYGSLFFLFLIGLLSLLSFKFVATLI